MWWCVCVFVFHADRHHPACFIAVFSFFFRSINFCCSGYPFCYCSDVDFISFVLKGKTIFLSRLSVRRCRLTIFRLKLHLSIGFVACSVFSVRASYFKTKLIKIHLNSSLQYCYRRNYMKTVKFNLFDSLQFRL